MRSPVDVVSKAFAEKAAPELGSKRDKTCQMERDGKDGSGKGNCTNHSTAHDGRWCLGKIQAKKVTGKNFPRVSLFCTTCKLMRFEWLSQMWREV